jgi:hypothetical protein
LHLEEEAAVDDATLQQMGCRRYQARLEDYLSEDGERVDADPELAAHLRECGACAEALEAGRLAGVIVRGACEPYAGVSGAFVTRVMAAIRDEESRRGAVGTIWRPVELLASRFALVASVLLLAASVYLVEFAPPFQTPASTSQAQFVGLMPEPPAQPSNRDEVLLTLVEMENGY